VGRAEDLEVLAGNFVHLQRIRRDALPAICAAQPSLPGEPCRIGASGQKADAWTPDLCLLVGIVTTWCPDEKVILEELSNIEIDGWK
jgi:hypothetical protein